MTRYWLPALAGFCLGLAVVPGLAQSGYQPDPGETAFDLQSETYFEELQQAATAAGHTACLATATHESPLNLVTANVLSDPALLPLETLYTKYPFGDPIFDTDGVTRTGGYTNYFDFFNNGHTVQIITDRYNYSPRRIASDGHVLSRPDEQHIRVDGRIFRLSQIHFHRPSEHLLDGKRYAMEMHMVHEAPVRQPGLPNEAVLAVFMDIGPDHNQVFREVFYRFRNVAVGRPPMWQIPFADVDLEAMLPANRSYIRYDGSLTTPPCTEDVAWHVFTTPITISEEQVSDFRRAIPFNARLVQNEHNVNSLRRPPS